MPEPRRGETKEQFIPRCVKVVMGEGKTQDQALGQCYGMWKQGKNESTINYDVDFSEAVFKDDDNRIENVAFLGPVSKNGYSYLPEAMQKATPLFNGVQLYINHRTPEEEKTGRRDVMRLAGKGVNPRFVDGKIRGDAELLPDQWGQKFLNIARMMPDQAGLSQDARGRMRSENGKKFVEEITHVFSVDLVANPATTKGMYESETFLEKQKMDYAEVTMNELRIRRPDICEELVAEGKKSRNEEVQKLSDENKAHRVKLDEYAVREKQAETADAVDKLLKDSKLPEEAKTDVFRSALITAKDDQTRKALIDDRADALKKKGVHSQGGGKSMTEGISNEDALEALHTPVRL